MPSGVEYKLYRLDTSPTSMPDPSGLESVQYGVVEQPSSKAHHITTEEDYALRFVSKLDIPTAGEWTINLISDDGSRLWLDGVEIIENDGTHATETESATLTLTAGEHDLEVRFFQGGGGRNLIVQWQGPGMESPMTIPSSALPDLVVDFFLIPDNTQLLPTDLDTRTPEATTMLATQVNHTAHSRGTFVVDDYMLVFTGELIVPSTGSWTFYLDSEDGSELYINGSRIVDNFIANGSTQANGSITLTAGTHPFEIRYFETTGETDSLTVEWEGPGTTRAVIPAANYQYTLVNQSVISSETALTSTVESTWDLTGAVQLNVETALSSSVVSTHLTSIEALGANTSLSTSVVSVKEVSLELSSDTPLSTSAVSTHQTTLIQSVNTALSTSVVSTFELAGTAQLEVNTPLSTSVESTFELTGTTQLDVDTLLSTSVTSTFEVAGAAELDVDTSLSTTVVSVWEIEGSIALNVVSPLSSSAVSTFETITDVETDTALDSTVVSTHKVVTELEAETTLSSTVVSTQKAITELDAETAVSTSVVSTFQIPTGFSFSTQLLTSAQSTAIVRQTIPVGLQVQSSTESVFQILESSPIVVQTPIATSVISVLEINTGLSLFEPLPIGNTEDVETHLQAFGTDATLNNTSIRMIWDSYTDAELRVSRRESRVYIATEADPQKNDVVIINQFRYRIRNVRHDGHGFSECLLESHPL